MCNHKSHLIRGNFIQALEEIIMLTTARKLSSYAIKHLDDVELLKLYRTNRGTSYGDMLLQELFNRHDNMLRNLATKLLAKRPYMNTVEDCLQTARRSAMVAYDRFDFSNKKAKLSTYVYSTVKFEMLTQADQESFVKCPSQMREFRVYYMGGYDNDPVKKASFESKWNLDSQEAIDAKKMEVEALLPTFLTLCDPYYNSTGEESSRLQEYEDQNAHSAETLTYLAQIDKMKSEFNQIQKDVFYYVWELECTIPETAEALNTTTGKVISANRGIKRIIESHKRSMRLEENL
jgi:RNA polymerase sigma factor (sigma-70 family)